MACTAPRANQNPNSERPPAIRRGSIVTVRGLAPTPRAAAADPALPESAGLSSASAVGGSPLIPPAEQLRPPQTSSAAHVPAGRHRQRRRAAPGRTGLARWANSLRPPYYGRRRRAGRLPEPLRLRLDERARRRPISAAAAAGDGRARVGARRRAGRRRLRQARYNKSVAAARPEYFI